MFHLINQPLTFLNTLSLLTIKGAFQNKFFILERPFLNHSLKNFNYLRQQVRIIHPHHLLQHLATIR